MAAATFYVIAHATLNADDLQSQKLKPKTQSPKIQAIKIGRMVKMII